MLIMKKAAVLFFLLIFSMTSTAQPGFRFESAGRRKVTIPFKFINNLIVLSVNVNGADLNFLLDTGVDETILFSIDDQDQVKLNNIQRILLKGLGGNEPVEGLKSSHNKLSFPGYSDSDHDIYIVLDQDFNFSASIGIPVNGIIGYGFFKNNLIEINYDRKKIIVYNENEKARKKVASQFVPHDISIVDGKPYLIAELTADQRQIPARLLVDTGNTDAVWLFQDKSGSFKIPDQVFDDFLGRGLSGDIVGKRGRIENFAIDSFGFQQPLVAFPDVNATKNIVMAEGRVGSVGGEILKRFTVVFDYKNGKIFLRKGREYSQPFNYNMSGLEVHHEGMTWVKERIDFSATKKYAIYQAGEPTSFAYKFELKPLFSVSNVRKDSPAALCGIEKGDLLVSLNRTPCDRMTLQEINSILKSEEGKTIDVEVERHGIKMKFSFRLKSII
ncbi:MAG: PDZ domain-containing protein [Flavobacterium sp.]|nr:MAG: PDZ domain-containing protein [Flavobacterium sp.]